MLRQWRLQMLSEKELRTWQEQHLPHFHAREMQFVVSWLVKDRGRPNHLAELYDTIRFRDETLRSVISSLSLHGLVEISRDSRDNRRFLAKPTIKLQRRMSRYARMLADLFSQQNREGAT